MSIQYDGTPASSLLKKTYRSPSPAFNTKRQYEPVATCTMCFDTPSMDDGSTFAQLFVGTKNLVTDAYGMKTDKQFVNTLEDNIRKRETMEKII